MDNDKDISFNITRMLQNPWNLSTNDYQKLLNHINKSPTSCSILFNKIEIAVLNVINSKESDCKRQKAVHPHFETDLILRRICLASSCFTSIHFFVFPRKSSKFSELQLRLALGICDTLSKILHFYSLPHENILHLTNQLMSKVKPFTNLTIIDRDKMVSDEFLSLVFARCDFFTHALRVLFESDFTFTCHIPIFVSIFNSVFSINLTEGQHTSNRLLISLSRLLMSVGVICRKFRACLIPASPCILTILSYQLEWTGLWYDKVQFMEGYVRTRLATLFGLENIFSKIVNGSYTRLLQILPKLLAQLTNDLMITTQGVTNLESIESTNISKMSSDNYQYRKSIMVATLNLLVKLGCNPMLFSVEMQNFKTDFDVNTSIYKAISRIQLCMGDIINSVLDLLRQNRTLYQNYEFESSTFIIQPNILCKLIKASHSLSVISKSMIFQNILIEFLQKLTSHSDDQVNLLANKDLRLLICDNSNFMCNLPSKNSENVTSFETSKIREKVHCYSNTCIETTEPVTNLIQSFHLQEKTDSNLLLDVKDGNEYGSSSSSKRIRLINDSEDIKCSVNSVEDPSLNQCLSTFDPTFV